MTPLQIAREECANYESDGSCFGAQIREDGRLGHCAPKPHCVLSDGGRCAYLEECVLPMDRSELKPAARQAWDDGLRAYWRKVCKISCGAGRVCPDCRRELQSHQRYCYICAQNRRRRTFRSSQAKNRCHVNSSKHGVQERGC